MLFQMALFMSSNTKKPKIIVGTQGIPHYKEVLNWCRAS